MMHKLLNAQKAHALAAQAGLMMPPHAGIISSYDPVNFAVKVRLQPHDVETGWLPLMSPWVGNGWGMFCAPSLGDLIDVQFLEGSAEVGFACLRWFTDSARPLNVPSGEFWLVHSSGAYLKLTNDGKVAINTAVELDAGNLGAALHTLVTDAFMAIYNSHTHNDPQGGVSSAPNQPMTSTHLTTVLKAN